MQGIKHAGCNNNENRKEYHRSSWDSIGGIKPQTNVTGEKIPNKKKKKKRREKDGACLHLRLHLSPPHPLQFLILFAELTSFYEPSTHLDLPLILFI